MNYLISENQMQTILIESVREKLSENAKKLNDIAKEIIEDVQINNGLNFKFLLTWGASIGGMMGPLRNWIENNYVGMDPHDIALLTLGAVATYFYDNETNIKALHKKIKEKGLVSEFNEIQNKADQFKSVFIRFLSSLSFLPINSNAWGFIFIANSAISLFCFIDSGALASNKGLSSNASMANSLLDFNLSDA